MAMFNMDKLKKSEETGTDSTNTNENKGNVSFSMQKVDVAGLLKNVSPPTTSTPKQESVDAPNKVTVKTKTATKKESVSVAPPQAPPQAQAQAQAPPKHLVKNARYFAKQVGEAVIINSDIEAILDDSEFLSKLGRLCDLIDDLKRVAKEIDIEDSLSIPGTQLTALNKKERTYHPEILSPKHLVALNNCGALKVQISTARANANNQEVKEVVDILDKGATYTSKGTIFETPYGNLTTMVAKATAHIKGNRDLYDVSDDCKRLINVIGIDAFKELAGSMNDVGEEYEQKMRRV